MKIEDFGSRGTRDIKQTGILHLRTMSFDPQNNRGHLLIRQMKIEDSLKYLTEADLTFMAPVILTFDLETQKAIQIIYLIKQIIQYHLKTLEPKGS